MRIKGIKIDEDVARILNEQDNDDTSKYRVYSNDIKEAIELPMDIPNEPYIEVTLDYGRPLLGYRLIDGVLYYTGRNGTKQIGKNVTLDNLAKRILSHAKNITKMNIDKIEVDDKVIWDYADGFINESINEEVLPHNLPKLNKLIDRLNNSGYWKVNGDEIRVDHGFGTVAEQMDLTDLADEFRKIGFKVYVSHFSIQVDGLKDYMEKQNNKNESINEEFIDEPNKKITVYFNNYVENGQFVSKPLDIIIGQYYSNPGSKYIIKVIGYDPKYQNVWVDMYNPSYSKILRRKSRDYRDFENLASQEKIDFFNKFQQEQENKEQNIEHYAVMDKATGDVWTYKSREERDKKYKEVLDRYSGNDYIDVRKAYLNDDGDFVKWESCYNKNDSINKNSKSEKENEIKIDEDVARILNEQDKDDTSKYRVYYTNESINEDYEEDDFEDVPEEMHKERYVTYFETQEGRQRYTIYHVYTDSTDDSYNELCDKRDNQLGMYDSYKKLRDALKERAEKIAEQQGWTVKSIENLGEDDEYYKERNKWESIKESLQDELIKEANKITGRGMLYMPVRKLAAKLMDRVKGASSEEALKVAKMFFKETKNESIKEDTYMDKYKAIDDKVTELAQNRAKIDFVSKMNPQDLVNYAVKAIKRNDANISDVENMLNKANYTPGQIEDILDMIRTNLDEAYYKKRNKWESIKEGFNIGDKVQLKRKNNKIGIVKSIFKGDKDKNGKDIKYLDVEFEDGTKEGRPASDFKKVNEFINEAGKCTWHAWQEGKKYACIDDCTYGHIDDFIGMEEDIEKFVKAGWVNANGEIVIPAGAEFQVRKLHTPNGIVLYFPDVDMELDTGLDEDDDTLYEIINESKNEDYEDVQRIINKEDTNEFPKGSFAEWFGEDLTGQTYEGDIDCSNEELTSLYGAPEYVEGHFYCYNNKLTSLKGAPEYVGGWFDCSDNNLTSLEGAPEHVEGRFDCSSNDLTSLEGAPKEVNGNFNCSHNQLTTLEGAPEKVTNDFYCYNNKLTSLKGAPEYIGGGLICINNPDLESLEGVGEVEDSIYSDIEE